MTNTSYWRDVTFGWRNFLRHTGGFGRDGWRRWFLLHRCNLSYKNANLIKNHWQSFGKQEKTDRHSNKTDKLKEFKLLLRSNRSLRGRTNKELNNMDDWAGKKTTCRSNDFFCWRLWCRWRWFLFFWRRHLRVQNTKGHDQEDRRYERDNSKKAEDRFKMLRMKKSEQHRQKEICHTNTRPWLGHTHTKYKTTCRRRSFGCRRSRSWRLCYRCRWFLIHWRRHFKIQDPKIMTKKTKHAHSRDRQTPEQYKTGHRTSDIPLRYLLRYLLIIKQRKHEQIEMEFTTTYTSKRRNYLQGERLSLQEQEKEMKVWVLVLRASSPPDEILWEYKMPRSRSRRQKV